MKTIKGSHGVTTIDANEYPTYVSDWDALVRDVKAAIHEYETTGTTAALEEERAERQRQRQWKESVKYIADSLVNLSNEDLIGFFADLNPELGDECRQMIESRKQNGE